MPVLWLLSALVLVKMAPKKPPMTAGDKNSFLAKCDESAIRHPELVCAPKTKLSNLENAASCVLLCFDF